MAELVFTSFFPFCGMGAGARGFLDAQVSLLGTAARFRSLGGIDSDPLACADFEALTESPALCTDIATMTPAELRAFAGARAPDAVFLSPPCKGFSGLLSTKRSRDEKYQRMNRLAVDCVRLLLSTWNEPPGLVLFENVPRIASRGAPLLREIRRLLRAAGYVFHDGHHDCGELGGLAQRRRRYLLVARHARRVPPLLYQPQRRRVRGCGEVLGELPMPEDPSAGPLHKLPRISWLNWVRLALIPAGGDWRDLPGVLDGAARRSKFERLAIVPWDEPTGTIAGSGSNGVYGVADPRVSANEGRHWNKYRVEAWWHRPLTTLELAALQGIPTRVRGEPLRLAGSSVSGWRERIGNAVPPPAARAIAEQMLVTLVHADLESFALSSGGAVWVEPVEART